MIGTQELNLSTMPGHLQYFDVTAEVGLEQGEYGDYSLLHIEIIDRSNANKEHYGLKFNVDWADSDRIEWLADILSRNLAENIWNAKKNQRQYIQSAAYQFGKALGLDVRKLG
jgi:hypothetical protein